MFSEDKDGILITHKFDYCAVVTCRKITVYINNMTTGWRSNRITSEGCCRFRISRKCSFPVRVGSTILSVVEALGLRFKTLDARCSIWAKAGQSLSSIVPRPLIKGRREEPLLFWFVQTYPEAGLLAGELRLVHCDLRSRRSNQLFTTLFRRQIVKWPVICVNSC